MTSPEWPKWQFKDGRKRMTLPIVDDGRGEQGERDPTTPKPIRLNSTESAVKRAKTGGGEKDPTTPKPIRLNSTESAVKRARNEGGEKTPTSTPVSTHLRRISSKKGGGGWLCKESTQREIKARRSIDSLADTVPDRRSIGSLLETIPDSVPDRRSIDSRLETIPGTVPDRRSINSPLLDTVPGPQSIISLPKTLTDTETDRRSINSRPGTPTNTLPVRRSISSPLADTVSGHRSINSPLMDTVSRHRLINSRPGTLADTVKDRRSIDSRPATPTNTIPVRGSISSPLADTVPGPKSINSRPKTVAVSVTDHRSINSLADTIHDRRSIESLPDTEKKIAVERRPSIEVKKKSGAPLRALENVKSGVKEKLQDLPDPLSELMLEREESVRREKEVKKRKEDQKESNIAAPAAIAGCSKTDGREGSFRRPSNPLPRKHSFFYPAKRTIAPQRRASLESTVALPDWSTIDNGEDTVAAFREESRAVRRKSISPLIGKRDGRIKTSGGRIEKRKGGEGVKKGRVSRRLTDGVATGNWVTPSLQDFRPSFKQARRSAEAVKEKETTVVVRRESTSVVPATPMTSEKEGSGGERRVSLDPSRLVSPTASDFVPLNGRKKSVRSPFFGEKMDEDGGEEDVIMKVKPETQLSWGRLASAIYRKTSVRTEVSIGSTVPGEFEEEEVELERQKERMNSITSLKSDKSEAAGKKPAVDRFLSSISLATTRGPSNVSVVKDSLEEEEEPNDGFRPMIIDDQSQPDEFEIKDTVQEGAPKEMKFTKPHGLGLFRRPLVPPSEGRPSSLSPPPPSRQSSGGSTASANPRGRRQIGGVAYEDKLSKLLEKALYVRRSERTLLKHDNSAVTSAVLTIEGERSSGWGVSLAAHSRGYVLLPGNTAPPEGSCVRVALPLQRVLESVAVSPTVL